MHAAQDSQRDARRRRSSPLHIGFLAPELHHEHGGMAEYEYQLALALAAGGDVSVYSMEPHAVAPELGDRPILSRDLRVTRERLARETVDVWFACNAALAALAPALRAPLVPFCNGNDVLNPWLRQVRPWVEALAQRRFVWRFSDRIGAALRMRDVRRGFRRVPRIVANSRNTARLVERVHPGSADRTSVIPPGVADDFFQARPGPRAPGPLHLLTVSRLEQWTARKNVDGVLRALTLLPADLPVTYTVVGDGDDRARIEGIARTLGVADRVTFRGAVPRDELRACYCDADLFVLASRVRPNDVEGFGIVYLEAAAAGLPSLCSAEGGATDAVADGVSGIIIHESAPAAIADGIRRFVRERDRLTADNVRAFAEGFRWSAIGQRVRDELETAVAIGRAR